MVTSLLPLALGVRPTSGAEKANPSSVKSKVAKAQARDDFTCRFCGFHSPQFQRAIPWADAGDPPIATVCIFCEQVLSLERAGITGAGLLIWLPEIGQAELNHLARAIYVARAGKGAMAGLATRALDALTARRSEAKKRLGSDDPLLLATVLRESLEADEAGDAVTRLDGIRLLPPEKYIMRGAKGDANQFPQIVKFWTSPAGPFAQAPADAWQDMLKKALATTGHA